MATITNRGPYQFQAIVRRKGYPTQTKTFESKKEATSWVRKVETEMEEQTFRDKREVNETTFGDALIRYKDSVSVKKKGSTAEINRINQLMLHPLSRRSLASLRSADFAKYRDERLKVVSGTSVRLELAIVSHLFTIAINEWSMPLENPIKKIRKPKNNESRERRLVGDEYERLLEGANRPRAVRTSMWLQACIVLAVETGMRAGEILSMTWQQVNLKSPIVKLDETKNGSCRVVPLSEVAVKTLRELPRHINGRVIQNFYDTSGLDRAFKGACKAAGIEGLHFHDLRHEAASQLAPHMGAHMLAKIMGWKTIQMAMRYYNPNADELVKAIRFAKAA